MLGGRLAQTLQKKAHLLLHFHRVPQGIDGENIYIGDLGDEKHIDRLAEALKPAIIINCAAQTDVDGCEREPDKSKNSNFTAATLLLDRFPEAKMVQVSTDYVFGERDRPGRPDDATDPLNTYGKHKLQAEEKTLEASSGNLVIRTNTTYDKRRSNNFFKFVFDSLSADKKIFGVIDQSSNPISSFSAAEIIVELINSDASGIFHIGGKDFVSRFEFAQLIARDFEFDSNLIGPKKAVELNRLAARPHTAGLDCSLTSDFLKRPMPTIADDFARIKKDDQA